MKELWSTMIDVDKENELMQERWDEIYHECFKAIQGNTYRQKQAAMLALTDLLPNREWTIIQKNFRIVFLTALASVEDADKDSVKYAAYQLVKSMRRITLKYANVYTNSDE